MSVNNTTLRWPMLDRGVDRIRLWYWMKVRYYSTAKLEPLNFFYRDKIRSLKLKANVLLDEYVDRFQGLEILQREMGKNLNWRTRSLPIWLIR